ncbi:MAG: hypothetical protein A2Y33_10915 [Spirochaetes bacterium GWF1_51_8]|nr:MAG: hypothetical protein A2Y33_10915 [Spirochaetes bacterium GWF1_51_8]
MLESIRLHNFKSFKDLAVEGFKRINLIVGRNNSGKSNLLEAMYIAHDPVNFELMIELNKARGIDSDWKYIRFFWNELFETLNIELIYKGQGYKTHIGLYEHVDFSKGKTVNNELGGFEGEGYSDNDKFIYYDGKIRLSEKRISISYKGNYQFSYRSKFVFESNNLNTEKSIDNISRYLEQGSIELAKEVLVEILDSDIKTINTAADDGRTIVYVTGSDGKGHPLNHWGAGTERIFNLILTMSECKDGVILIDEIDNGLFYNALRLLWDKVMYFAEKYNVQVFATTHSHECIQHLVESAVANNKKDDLAIFRIEKYEEKSIVVELDYEKVAQNAEFGYDVRGY